MRSGANNQLTLARGRRTAFFTQEIKIGDGVLQKDIVPATYIQRWHGYLVMMTKDVRRAHQVEIALQWVIGGLEEDGSNILLLEGSKFSQGQRGIATGGQCIHRLHELINRHAQRLGIALVAAHQQIQSLLKLPRASEPQFQPAAPEEHAIDVIIPGLERHHSLNSL